MSGPLLYTKGNQSQGRVLGYKKGHELYNNNSWPLRANPYRTIDISIETYVRICPKECWVGGAVVTISEFLPYMVLYEV